MKALMIAAALVLTVSVSHAADTTFIPASEVTHMLTFYINEAYQLDKTPRERELMQTHPEISRLVDLWMQTDEGHILSNTDANWDDKMKSFLRKYPHLSSKQNIIAPIMRWHVLLNIQLFYYANDATIVLVDGKFDGILFDAESKTPWYRDLRDPVFQRMYEYGRDGSGGLWYKWVNGIIRAHLAQEKRMKNKKK